MVLVHGYEPRIASPEASHVIITTKNCSGTTNIDEHDI